LIAYYAIALQIYVNLAYSTLDSNWSYFLTFL